MYSPRPSAFSSLVLMALLGACDSGSKERAVSWQMAVDTVGDTIVVRTTAGQLWSDTADLVAEVAIGEMDGADEYIFGRVSAIGVGQAGEIVVVDTQVPAVRIYGPDGMHRRTLGRGGSGPGEFKRPDGGLGVFDGRILVRDPGNGRITVYGIDGEYQANWLTHGGFSTSRKLYRDGEGNAYSMALKAQGVSLDEWQMVLVKYDHSGQAVDSLDAPTADLPPNYVEGRSENSMSRTGVPFMPGQNWTYSPRGYFVEAISTRYGIKLLRENQAHLLIEREYKPVRVASGEADQERARIERNFRQFPNWKWNGPTIPATKPPFDNVWVGDDGRIWARLYQPAEEEENPFYDPSEEGTFSTRWVSPTVFDVFEPDGQYLGSVRAPKGFSSYPEPVFRGDYVWAVVRDDFDVQRVVRYRVRVRGEPTD